jgi:hypothetical protein
MAEDLVGRDVVDPHGYKVGTIDVLFVHGEDTWAKVKMGVLGTDSSLIPLRDAQQDGDDVRIVYEREHVKTAPEVEPEGDELSDDDADSLHGHYGLERVVGLTSESEEDDIELSKETRDAEPPGMDSSPENPLNKRRRKRQGELKQAAEEFEEIKQN